MDSENNLVSQEKVNHLAKLIYERSNHDIPKEVCFAQAKNMTFLSDNTSSLEKLADDVIWAYNQ